MMTRLNGLLSLLVLLSSIDSVYAQTMDNFSELTDDQIVTGFVQTSPSPQEPLLIPDTTDPTDPTVPTDPQPMVAESPQYQQYPVQSDQNETTVASTEKSKLTILLDSGYVEGFGQLVVTPLSGSRVSISYNPSVCNLEAQLGSMTPSWKCNDVEEIISAGDIEPSTFVETVTPLAEDLVPMVAQSIGTLPGGFDLRVERRKNRPPRAFVIVDRRTLNNAASVITAPTQSDLVTVELYPNVSFDSI